MDNGISRVDTNSPLTKFGLQSGINTGVLCVNRFGGDLYAGTTNGLMKYDRTTSRFTPVSGIPLNQVFSLLPGEKELLIPLDGLFGIKDQKTYTIRASISGDLALTVLYVSPKHPNTLFCGGTFGVAIFSRPAGKVSSEIGSWQFDGYIPGITEPIWTVVENNDGKIWAGTQAGTSFLVTPFFNAIGDLDLQKTTFKRFDKEDGYKNGLGAGLFHKRQYIFHR